MGRVGHLVRRFHREEFPFRGPIFVHISVKQYCERSLLQANRARKALVPYSGLVQSLRVCWSSHEETFSAQRAPCSRNPLPLKCTPFPSWSRNSPILRARLGEQAELAQGEPYGESGRFSLLHAQRGLNKGFHLIHVAPGRIHITCGHAAGHGGCG